MDNTNTANTTSLNTTNNATSWADDVVDSSVSLTGNDATTTTTTTTDNATVSANAELDVGNTYVARVKWFNNTMGYGFVTVLDNDVDLFVHHSEIKPHTQCWRTLVTGEYVQLVVGQDDRGKKCGHNVTGIQGGQLLCESMTPYMRNRFQGPNNNGNTNTNTNNNTNTNTNTNTNSNANGCSFN